MSDLTPDEVLRESQVDGMFVVLPASMHCDGPTMNFVNDLLRKIADRDRQLLACHEALREVLVNERAPTKSSLGGFARLAASCLPEYDVPETEVGA